MSIIDDCMGKMRAYYSADIIDDEMLRDLATKVLGAVRGKTYDSRLKKLMHMTEEQIEFGERLRLENKAKLKEHKIALSTYSDKKTYVADLLGGSTRTGNIKDSLEVRINSTRNRNKGVLRQSMHSEGIDPDDAFELMANPKNTKDIFGAIEALNKGLDTNAIPEPILATAKGVRKTFGIVLKNMRDTGIDIMERMDYIIRQTHDPGKMGKVTAQEWSDFLHSKLDLAKTFEDVISKEDQLRILKDTYKDIGESDYTGIGSGSIGRKRTLHFKDAQAFAEYHLQFGKGSMLEVMESSLSAMSKNEAIYSKLGSNPKKMLADLKKEASKDLPPEEKKLYLKKNENLEKIVLGFGARPVEGRIQVMAGQFVDGAKNIQLVAKLPAALFSTVTDLSIATAKTMSSTGKGFGESLYGNFTSWMKMVSSPEERRQVAFRLGMVLQDEVERIHGERSSNAILGKYGKFMLKLNGLDAATTISRVGKGRKDAMYLADLSGNSLSALNPRMQSEFKSFGIGAKEWDIIRTNGVDTIGEVKMVTILKLEEAGVSRELVNRYAAMVDHSSKFGAVSPDAKTRELIYTAGGLFPAVDPNSTAGKSMSALMTFKTFSLRMFRVIDEFAKSNPEADNSSFLKAMRGEGNLKILGSMMVHAWVLSTGALMLKDIAFGKEPRNPFDPEFLAESLGRSVIPLGFDYMLDAAGGEYDSPWKNVLSDIAGPVFGQIHPAVKFASALAKDINPFDAPSKGRKAIGDLRLSTVNKGVKLIENQLPMNIPIIRPLIDKAFLHSLHDAINPNYSRNLGKKMAKQDYLFDSLAP